MPRLVPTSDELARMSPAQKAKVRRYVAKVALELDEYAHLSLSARAAERHRDLVAWGEAIREHARNLLAAQPPEPPHITSARRQALIEAIR